MAAKKLKIMKDKADNSHRRGKYELTQAYKSYSDYAFPNNENRHPHHGPSQLVLGSMNLFQLLVDQY